MLAGRVNCPLGAKRRSLRDPETHRRRYSFRHRVALPPDTQNNGESPRGVTNPIRRCRNWMRSSGLRASGATSINPLAAAISIIAVFCRRRSGHIKSVYFSPSARPTSTETRFPAGRSHHCVHGSFSAIGDRWRTNMARIRKYG